MRLTQRTRRAAVAAVMAAVIGGGVAVGAAAAGPGDTARTPAAAAQSREAARSGYADVVRRVLPSVVLIGVPTLAAASPQSGAPTRSP